MSRLVDDVRIRAWRALMHVHAGITDELEQELGKAHDLPLSWYQVLVELRIGGGALRMHRLAEAATPSRRGPPPTTRRTRRNCRRPEGSRQRATGKATKNKTRTDT